MPPARVKRGVSSAIAAVCMKAMAHDPADRYETPLELAHDVEHYLGDLPVTAYREPLTRRLARWTRRHRTLAQLGLAGLVAILLVAGSAAVMLRQLAADEYRARQTALLMAARLAAGTAALEVDARWRILEHEAVDPVLVAAVAAHEARQATPRNDDRDGSEAIQAVLERIERVHHDAVAAESWFVCDARGVQVARSPRGDTIGQSFSHRDYFHGGDGDLSVATQTVRAPPEIVARLREASRRRPTDPQSLTFDAEVPTIAAAEPIVIATRPGSLGDLDWAVLVEER
jgi:eukaryotic-like serine/threonine-protein kinase